jgi:hypothetical protein
LIFFCWLKIFLRDEIENCSRCILHHGRVDAVDELSAIAANADKVGLLENAEMVAERWRGEVEVVTNITSV